jgi:hypothetical protein
MRRQILPSEIWLYIFQLVAREPCGTFNSSPLEPAHAGLRAWALARPHYKSPEYANLIQRANTRRALVLVSRTFYTLAIGILYEYVSLRSDDAVRSFGQALEADYKRRRNSGSALPCRSLNHLGRFTKYLEIVSDPSWEEWDDRRKREVASAFRLCTNLELVDISPYRSRYETELCRSIMKEILGNGCRPRYIKLDCDVVSFEALSDHHSAAIEVLSIVPPPWDTFRYPPDLDTSHVYTFPRLHCLKLNSLFNLSMIQWLSRCSMPALRRLSLPATMQGTSRHVYSDFYKTHGNNIWALDVHGETTPHLENLLSYFPHIQELTFHLWSFVPNLAVWSTVIAVGIFLPFAEPESEEGQDTMFRLAKCMVVLLERHSPLLKVVRLVGVPGEVFSRLNWMGMQLDLWRTWAKRWKEDGALFQLEGEQLVEEALAVRS